MHKLSKTKRGDYLLVGPYDEVLWVKIQQLPDDIRAWSKKLNAWHVHQDGVDQVQQVVDDHYLVDDDLARRMMERIRALEERASAQAATINGLLVDLGVGGLT